MDAVHVVILFIQLMNCPYTFTAYELFSLNKAMSVCACVLSVQDGYSVCSGLIQGFDRLAYTYVHIHDWSWTDTVCEQVFFSLIDSFTYMHLLHRCRKDTVCVVALFIYLIHCPTYMYMYMYCIRPGRIQCM